MCRANPYRTVVGASDRAVPKNVVEPVKRLVDFDLSSASVWEVPFKITGAGVVALAEES